MENFSFQISKDHRGLLWAFHAVGSAKATGVLRIKQASAGANEHKKEIVFHQGKVVACLTNRQQEGLANFLVNTRSVTRSEMAACLETLKSLEGRGTLPGVLMQRQVLDSEKLMASLLEHLRYRVFNWVGLRRGEISFIGADELPEKVFSKEEVKFSGDFLQEVWPSVVQYFDEEACRSYFAQRHDHPFRVSGDFPFPLGAASLRVWNDLLREPVKSTKLNHQQLQMAAVAVEFDQVSFGESGVGQLQKDLEDKRQKLKKQNFFEILGVEESSSSGELRKAYFQLVKRYHPDRLPADAEPSLRALCEEVFASINEAHSMLSDQEKREEYEAEIALERAGGRKAIEKRLAAEQRFDEGILSIRRNQYASAYTVLEEAKEGMAGDPEFEACFAYCAAMKQVEEKALNKESLPALLEKVQSALKQTKDNPDIIYYAAVLLKLNDQTGQALKFFDRVLELNPNFTEAASEARVIRMRMEKQGEKKPGWFKKG